VVIRFGRPLDALGHDVDDDGRSLDRRGRPVDLRGYFTDAAGAIAVDEQRDAEYTRLLGRRLVAAFPRESVFHATAVAARAIYDRLCAAAGTRDIYRLTRLPPGRTVAVADVIRTLGALRAQLAARPEAGRLHHRVASAGDARVARRRAARARQLPPPPGAGAPVSDQSCGSATSRSSTTTRTAWLTCRWRCGREREQGRHHRDRRRRHASALRSPSRWPGPAARSRSTPARRHGRGRDRGRPGAARGLPDGRVPEPRSASSSRPAPSWRRRRASW
jgi:catechol 2,3-dioxygenase-like lactoylglutathione lyase family enzyme